MEESQHPPNFLIAGSFRTVRLDRLLKEMEESSGASNDPAFVFFKRQILASGGATTYDLEQRVSNVTVQSATVQSADEIDYNILWIGSNDLNQQFQNIFLQHWVRQEQ